MHKSSFGYFGEEAATVVFAAYHRVERVLTRLLSGITFHASPAFYIVQSWVVAGLGGGAMMIAGTSLLALLTAAGLFIGVMVSPVSDTSAVSLHSLPLNAASLNADAVRVYGHGPQLGVTCGGGYVGEMFVWIEDLAGKCRLPSQRLKAFEKGLQNLSQSGMFNALFFILFIYLGSIIYSRTQSNTLAAIILAMLTFTVVDGWLAYSTRADFTVEQAFLDIVLSGLGLPIGALIAMALRRRSVEKVSALIRRMPQAKRDQAYTRLLDLIQEDRPAPSAE
jgi:hypothetical protein